jgi:hypothetical protein
VARGITTRNFARERRKQGLHAELPQSTTKGQRKNLWRATFFYTFPLPSVVWNKFRAFLWTFVQ